MAATIWKGTISFGLVNIPVRLHTAVREDRISFRMLREKDKCPLRYERVCKKDDEEVPWEEIAKGYEYEKGKFVILTDEDFKKAAAATTQSKTFDIESFVAEDEIDPRYFDKPYYLVPTGEGAKAYALLREAMRKAGTAAIGTITIRTRQSLAAIKVLGDALVLDVMRWAGEVVDAKEYHFPDADAEELRPQELKMAGELVKNLTVEFDPSQYRDEYEANLRRIIKAKLKGKEADLEEASEAEPTGVIDLVERLKESLEKGGGKPKRKTKSSGSKKKRKSA